MMIGLLRQNCGGRHGDQTLNVCGGDAWTSYQGHRDWHQQLPKGGPGDPSGREEETEREKALKAEIEVLKNELRDKGVDLERAVTRSGNGMSTIGGGAMPIQNDGTMNSTRELPELHGDVTPITLGDWLVTIGPVMRDITPISSVWWDVTMRESEKAYLEWRQATPMERVSFCPGLPVELSGQQFLRTEQRGVGLLLKAIPGDIKAVLVSARELCATTILFRLLTTYQPGGANEKALLLSHLTTTPTGKDLPVLATSLRTWRRYFQRAIEIDTMLPDPTLMVRSLDGPTQSVGAIDAQAAFRLSQMRSQLCLDEKPTQDTVYRYSQCILAEVETLVLTRAAAVSPGKASPPQPAIKMLNNAAPGTPPTNLKVCGFWGTDQGCKLGRGCRYAHDWANVMDKAARCWICSSTQHQRGDCPARSAGGSGVGAGSGGKGKDSGKDGKDGGKGKGWKGSEGKDGSKEGKDGKGKWRNPQVNKATTGSSGTSSSTPQGEAKSDGPTTPERAPENGGGSLNGADSSTKGLVDEVTSLLKTMRVAHSGGGRPTLNAIKLRKMDAGGHTTVLLDGGATNCLRRARSAQEYQQAELVQVSLASGTVPMKQSTTSKTLLVMDDVQPIIPLSDLVSIGVMVEWNAQGCKMRHAGRTLPVYLDEGCPVIGMKEGMELMRQVEEFHERRERLRMAVIRAAPGEVAPGEHDFGRSRSSELCGGFSGSAGTPGSEGPREDKMGSGNAAFEQANEEKNSEGKNDHPTSVLWDGHVHLGQSW